MRISLMTLLVFLSILALAACGGSTAQSSRSTGSAAAGAAQSATVAQPVGATTLSENYADALPVASQVILGSLKLDAGDAAGTAQALAIDADEAGKLLPLWQAYQSLSASDNTAAAELEALVNQIAGTMRPEQVQAIAAMQLTADDVGEVMRALGPGSFGGGSEGRDNAAMGGAAGGFAGPPPGEFPGGAGGPGGLGGASGGFAAAGPEARETAIAERMALDGGQGATFMARGLLNQLITSLRIKTGDLTEAQIQAQQEERAVMRWLTMVSETTGIAVEDLNTALTGGKSLSEAVKDRGGDLTAVETALREALKNNPNLDEQAIEDQIDSILNTKTQPQ